MAEPELNDAQVDASFEQMGCPGMAQGVNGGRLVQTTLANGSAKGALHTIHSHWLIGKRTGNQCRKEPDRMTMGTPVLAQQGECWVREGNIAVFIAFTALNVQLHARTVDLTNLEMNAFLQA